MGAAVADEPRPPPPQQQHQHEAAAADAAAVSSPLPPADKEPVCWRPSAPSVAGQLPPRPG